MIMADTQKQSAGQDPSAQAGKNAATAGQAAETKPVADLLLAILSDVRQQMPSTAAAGAPAAATKPLESKALEAVNQFREIVAALALQSPPNAEVSLTAVPDFVHPGEKTTIRWSSTNAQRVSLTARERGASIDKDLGELTPPAGGSKEVTLSITTTFIATAVTGLCKQSVSSPPVEVDVD
jgi:hypothetical protein